MFEVYKCAQLFTAYGTFTNLFLAFQFAITRPSDPITNELTLILSLPTPLLFRPHYQAFRPTTIISFSKKGTMQIKHLGFRAPRALVDFFFCSGPGAYGLENFATAEASPFGGQTSALGRTLTFVLPLVRVVQLMEMVARSSLVSRRRVRIRICKM